MRKVVFTTQRLIAHYWTGTELEALLAVYGDGDAMRWVGDGCAITHAQCEQWTHVTLANDAKHGYGMYALEEKATGSTIGFCGIVHPGGQAEAEVKYAFLRSHCVRTGVAVLRRRQSLVYWTMAFRLMDSVISSQPPRRRTWRRIESCSRQGLRAANCETTETER